MREIKERNTEQHWERNSENTQDTCVYVPQAYILHSQRGEGSQYIKSKDSLAMLKFSQTN